MDFENVVYQMLAILQASMWYNRCLVTNPTSNDDVGQAPTAINSIKTDFYDDMMIKVKLHQLVMLPGTPFINNVLILIPS